MLTVLAIVLVHFPLAALSQQGSSAGTLTVPWSDLSLGSDLPLQTEAPQTSSSAFEAAQSAVGSYLSSLNASATSASAALSVLPTPPISALLAASTNSSGLTASLTHDNASRSSHRTLAQSEQSFLTSVLSEEASLAQSAASTATVTSNAGVWTGTTFTSSNDGTLTASWNYPSVSIYTTAIVPTSTASTSASQTSSTGGMPTKSASFGAAAAAVALGAAALL